MNERYGRLGWLLVCLPVLAINLAKTSVSCAADAARVNPQIRPPEWPQRFDIKGPETAGFGFILTQPGRVVVDVQAAGAPVTVTLGNGRSILARRSGAGRLVLEHQASAQDLADPPVWHVDISLAIPLPLGVSPVANGVVIVQEPPTDAARRDSALQRLTSAGASRGHDREDTQLARARANAAVRTMDAAFAERRRQFAARQQMDRQQAFDRVQPKLEQARARMAAAVSTRAITKDGSTMASSAMRERITRVPAPQPTASSSQALEAAGSGPPPQSVVPNPSIGSLDRTAGRPGFPVTLAGSAFGSGGTVYFILAPSMTVAANVDFWSDSQILTSVPLPTTSILDSEAKIYVERADGVRSQLVSFTFQPELDYRQLRSTTDVQLGSDVSGSDRTTITHNIWDFFAGRKGDDYIFLTTHLRNGWTVVRADVYDVCVNSSGTVCRGGNYVDTIKAGTDMPYLKVHWWLPPATVDSSFHAQWSQIRYTYSVDIVGPKNFSDGVAVP